MSAGRWVVVLLVGVVGCGRIAPGTAGIMHEESTCGAGGYCAGMNTPGVTPATGTPVYTKVCDREQYYDGNMIKERCK